eukprot:TRINITY_DN24450_c0_g1_i1.p1 TRINITY_DN24450_c0_g1~~TRINITY_DN24450_c0_g1_i1.p1  ORF type:complete len:485 (-),score=135.14 TRINITY_DN24450_c0_g1_i1:279-1733(-)
MGSIKTLSLLLCFIGVHGLPKQDDNYAYYNEQEYKDDYDYGDDDVPVNDVDGTSDNSLLIHRPVIISESIQMDVDNGMTIRLPCIVDKLPGEISIIWSKEDEKKTIIAMGTRVLDQEYRDRATVMVDDKGSTLTIGIAKSEDAGQYKCSVAVKKNPPEIKHIVRIRAPPSIESSTPSILAAKKGDDVTLNCKGSGSPKPTVKWSRVGKMMPDGSSEIESDMVTFSDVSRKHAGIYKCSATNGHGKEASKQVEVVVEYSPEVEVTEVFVQTKTGDETEIVCRVHAVPKPTIVWSKDGRILSSSNRVKIAKMGSRHTLTISQVQKGDFGKYTCQASNSLGSEEKIVEMTGHASPADFKSAASGHSENTFLLEWTSKSFTQIEEFLLETSLSPSGSWSSYTVVPTAEGAYHFAGKQFLTDLQPATPYRARVSAKNGEGWGKPGPVWNFSTKGAVPSPASVTASATSSSSSTVFMLSCLSLLLLRYKN